MSLEFNRSYIGHIVLSQVKDSKRAKRVHSECPYLSIDVLRGANCDSEESTGVHEYLYSSIDVLWGLWGP